jgi:hypothetical protein
MLIGENPRYSIADFADPKNGGFSRIDEPARNSLISAPIQSARGVCRFGSPFSNRELEIHNENNKKETRGSGS